MTDLVGLPLAEACDRLAGAGFSFRIEETAPPEEAARRHRRRVGDRPGRLRVVRAQRDPEGDVVRLLVARFPLPPVPPEVFTAVGCEVEEGEDAGAGRR